MDSVETFVTSAYCELINFVSQRSRSQHDQSSINARFTCCQVGIQRSSPSDDFQPSSFYFADFLEDKVDYEEESDIQQSALSSATALREANKGQQHCLNHH